MRVRNFLSIIPFLFLVHVVHAAPAFHIVISEVKITGLTGFSTDEYVELYNPTDSPVDITGWQLVKRTASGAAYPLVPSFDPATVAAHGYFLIAHPSGYAGSVLPDARYTTTNSLSSDNSVELVNSSGIVDLVGWGSATHVEHAAAPTPGNAKSIERKALPTSTSADLADGGADTFRGNGEDTDANDADFVSRDVPDPQSSTSDLEFITAPAPAVVVPTSTPSTKTTNTNTSPVVAATPSPHTVSISEILPDPVGSDDAEFIELVNTGDAAVDLQNWKLADASKTSYVIPTGRIAPGGWFVVKRMESGIALNNTGGESVTLTAPDGVVTSTVSYKGTAPEGQSYAIVGSAWAWTGKPTPGAVNIMLDPNHAPVAVMSDVDPAVHVHDVVKLSASGSSDADGDDLSFQWAFSDGSTTTGTTCKHVFSKAGAVTVTLTAADSKGKSGTAKFTFTVQDYQRSTAVVISRVVPNPADGEDEYVELANLGDPAVNLAGWSLAIGEKQQHLDGEIAGRGSLRLSGDTLSLALRNAGATLELMDPDGKRVGAVTWTAVARGAMVARQADGTYAVGDASVDAPGSGQVAGESVAVATPAETPAPSGEPRTRSTFPAWSWFVILGVAGVAWGSWAFIQRRRQRATQEGESRV